MALVYGQDARVAQWVAEQHGMPDGAPAYASIGYELDGELVAGVMFDNLSETNVFAHIASTAEVLPVALLIAAARYVYLQCGARRMTFMVNDDNFRCLDLVRALGAEYEGLLRGAHARGDVLIFALWDTSRFYRKLIATGRLVAEDETFT